MVLKDGTEHFGVPSNYHCEKRGPVDARVYSASLPLITEKDMEIDLDLLDVTSIDEWPEKDAAMATILRSRGAVRR